MLDQWVCCRKDSKVPMQTTKYAPASSSDYRTWGTFQQAVQDVQDGSYDYIGFVFADNGIVGIDIDCGFDEDGMLTDIATDIMFKCNSYTEISRSGRGLHILVHGRLPFKGRNNQAGVEIYQTGRFFIMTGDVVGTDEIINNQNAIDYVVSTYFQTERTSSGGNGDRIYHPVWKRKQNGKIQLQMEYPKITCGSRNLCLTSLGGMLRSAGYSKQQMYRQLMRCNNAACNPTLSVGQVQSIVDSIMRYKH